MAEAATQEAPATEAPAQGAPPAEAPSAAPAAPPVPQDPSVWWKAAAPKASALILLGKGPALEKAAAVAQALKLPVHRPADEKSLRELLEKDPAAALFLQPEGIKDPWMRLLAQIRKEAAGKGRRVVVGADSLDRRLMQAAYALPPTGVWLASHEPAALAKVLLAPLPCA